jgi:hypothetical protein
MAETVLKIEGTYHLLASDTRVYRCFHPFRRPSLGTELSDPAHLTFFAVCGVVIERPPERPHARTQTKESLC